MKFMLEMSEIHITVDTVRVGGLTSKNEMLDMLEMLK